MKVVFTMGRDEETVQLPDELSEEEIGDAFHTWLWNHTDLGWHKVEEDE